MYQFLQWVATLPVLALIAWKLLWIARHFRQTDVVVVMPEGGFGHTIHGPDVARRLYVGQRTVFVVLSEYQRHNCASSLIWPDISVFFLPLSIGFRASGRAWAFGQTPWLKNVIPPIIFALARWMSGSRIRRSTLMQLYTDIPVNEAYRREIAVIPAHRRHHLAVFRLMDETPAPPPVHLPDKIRQPVVERLARLRNSSDIQERLCALYLRQRGPGDASTFGRDGSTPDEYRAAIQLLVASGYQVLLTGDRILSVELYEEFRGMLLDYRFAKVDRKLFNIFAATEPHIFIGEHGGGSLLPGINRIPRLLVNMFPYYVALPHSWMYYKTVTDETGKMIHFKTLFSKYPYDFELPGMTLHSNTSNELAAAVKAFISDIAHPGPDPYANVLAGLSDNVWIKHLNDARLSPAFVRLFEGS